MKLKLILAALGAALGAVAVQADEAITANLNPTPPAISSNENDLSGRLGAGLILGEPTGVSLKYFLNDRLAVDGAVGWSLSRENDLYLQSDFLWHQFDLISVPRGQLPFYVGVGARVQFRDHEDDRVGIRVPFGVSYIFDGLPLDVFAEVAPVLDFVPSTKGRFTAGVGARWWF